jgi:RTX calcium-binding nonapeptide repeat (4 copies)
MEKGTMRKTAAIMALLALFTPVAAGVAVAVTATCSSVPCLGTPSADRLKERVGDGKRDVIRGGRGADRLRADRYGADTDTVYGGRGNDRLSVEDGDSRDRAVGGPGKRDVCFADTWSESTFRDCEILAST